VSLHSGAGADEEEGTRERENGNRLMWRHSRLYFATERQRALTRDSGRGDPSEQTCETTAPRKAPAPIHKHTHKTYTRANLHC